MATFLGRHAQNGSGDLPCQNAWIGPSELIMGQSFNVLKRLQRHAIDRVSSCGGRAILKRWDIETDGSNSVQMPGD